MSAVQLNEEERNELRKLREAADAFAEQVDVAVRMGFYVAHFGWADGKASIAVVRQTPIPMEALNS